MLLTLRFFSVACPTGCCYIHLIFNFLAGTHLLWIITTAGPHHMFSTSSSPFGNFMILVGRYTSEFMDDDYFPNSSQRERPFEKQYIVTQKQKALCT